MVTASFNVQADTARWIAAAGDAITRHFHRPL